VGRFPCTCALSYRKETKQTVNIPLHHIRTGDPSPEVDITISEEESQLADLDKSSTYLDRFGTRLWTMMQQREEEPSDGIMLARGRAPTAQESWRAK
jgi:hypothetical protein